MHPSLRLGIELRAPAVAPGAGGALRQAVRGVAAAAEAAGVDMLWLAAGRGPRGPGPEPCTLAGALSATTSTLGLGIVAELEGNREPSVLARDLTTLDLLSAGRTALCLAEDGPGGGDALDRRAEAAAVCRRLFTEAAPSYEGEHYRIAAAANRPPPLQPGGPPIVIELGDPPADGAWALPASAARAAVDGVVTAADPDALGRLVEALAGAGARSGELAVLWRGGAEDPEGPSAALVRALRAAGAGGVIWQLAGDGLPEPAAVAPMAAALSAAWGEDR